MIQTILISKKWSLKKAKNWLIKHGYKTGVDLKKPGFWRFRQNPPKKTKSYYTKKIKNGLIHLVFFK